MSDFVEVKTADLTGPALDWAVAQVEGVACTPHTIKRFYRPSTDWSQGGPLRDKYDVGIEPSVPDGRPYAYVPGRDLDGSRGETALIAICRAIVAAKLGDVVQVPTALIGGAA
ncbi:Protein of unknown function [Aeromonas sp. RU39B]|uniref:phage protein NinX family protein n=1 Tax=Aeromonas sp. RU39B TaxID=1907416 RepID=UPI0009565648|nr:phage protein NinX family protein [Aeromonas sp. RU39B]SIR65520.1 Protein of unknown function [Aeromonas sp. RU39B]